MRARKNTRRLTLQDVVATVSGIARNERETAAVINHLLSSSKIRLANRAQADLRRMMMA